MTDIDLIVHSASQLLALTPEPQRGHGLGQLGLLKNAALAIDKGKILEAGPSADLRSRYSAAAAIDASGLVVLPGFVDPHTHAIFHGDRAAEFQERLSGVPYLAILERGGGIHATVGATRQASFDELVESARPRLETMLGHGTTTVEVKTGYGLTVESELRMLEAALELDRQLPIKVVPTLLGAHAIPREFQADPDGFVDLVVEEMLPQVRTWWGDRGSSRPLPFFDVFCERGAFSVEQTRRMLQAAFELGFPLKIHADEFEGLGCTAAAVSFGAVSADHLVQTPEDDIAALGSSDTVAVSLPLTPFGLGEDEYTPAGKFLDAGAILAIASDLNPGTAWCESLQMAMAVACRRLRLTPAQAIAASTINAAAALQMSDQIGSLTPGKRADLLILNAADYRHLGYRFGTNLVRTVIVDGEVIGNG